jgi:hypothetical protein
MTMLKAFLDLSLNMKVAVIVLHLVGIAIVILWVRFVTKRWRTRGLLRGIFSSHKQVMESSKNATSRYYKNESVQGPANGGIIWSYLLSKVSNTIKIKIAVFYRYFKKKRNNPKQYVYPFQLHDKYDCSKQRKKIWSIKKERNPNAITTPPCHCESRLNRDEAISQSSTLHFDFYLLLLSSNMVIGPSL